MNEIGRVLQFGADKYGTHNWRKGMQWSRLGSAALRHIFTWLRGTDVDAESGCHHLAHATVNLMFALEYYFEGIGDDDRYKGEE